MSALADINTGQYFNLYIEFFFSVWQSRLYYGSIFSIHARQRRRRAAILVLLCMKFIMHRRENGVER